MPAKARRVAVPGPETNSPRAGQRGTRPAGGKDHSPPSLPSERRTPRHEQSGPKNAQMVSVLICRQFLTSVVVAKLLFVYVSLRVPGVSRAQSVLGT